LLLLRCSTSDSVKGGTTPPGDSPDVQNTDELSATGEDAETLPACPLRVNQIKTKDIHNS